MPVGIITNCLSVLMGGAIGSRIGRKIPPHIRQSLPVAFGFVAMTMGIIKIAAAQSILAVTLSVLLGTLIGEWMGIDKALRKWALKGIHRFPCENEAEGLDLFVIATVIFCASGTGIFGAMEEGFTGDASILLSKAGLDFFTAILFSSAAGISIALLSIPQGVLMMSLYLSAGLISPWLSPTIKQSFLAVGGVITMMNGFSMASLSKIKPANSVPALLIVLVLGRFV
jgi:uncharacterized membrane protein YqgA involved in biofilm formation